MGPIISKRQLETNRRLREGGERRRPASPLAASGRGCRSAAVLYTPTLLDHVSADMRVAQEEIFGPVLAIISFDELDEAVDLANRSQYGLVAGVWTRDINKAMAVSSRIKSGQV